MIAGDSQTGWPSTTTTGTLPIGFSRMSSGALWSPLSRLSGTRS